MYNQQSIDLLINRIGWYPAIEPSTIEVSVSNQQSESGRFFNGFNPFVIAENVKASIVNKDADNDTLNLTLANLRKEGVMDVLQKVFNLNPRASQETINNVITSVNYEPSLIYDAMIDSNRQAFDEVIGLSVCIKALELIATTNRSNHASNNPKISNEMIQDFFHGAYSETGRVITKGLLARYREAIGMLINVLFPITYPPGSEVSVGGDGGISVNAPTTPPTLRARKVW